MLLRRARHSNGLSQRGAGLGLAIGQRVPMLPRFVFFLLLRVGFRFRVNHRVSDRVSF